MSNRLYIGFEKNPPPLVDAELWYTNLRGRPVSEITTYLTLKDQKRIIRLKQSTGRPDPIQRDRKSDLPQRRRGEMFRGVGIFPEVYDESDRGPAQKGDIEEVSASDIRNGRYSEPGWAETLAYF